MKQLSEFKIQSRCSFVGKAFTNQWHSCTATEYSPSWTVHHNENASRTESRTNAWNNNVRIFGVLVTVFPLVCMLNKMCISHGFWLLLLSLDHFFFPLNSVVYSLGFFFVFADFLFFLLLLLCEMDQMTSEIQNTCSSMSLYRCISNHSWFWTLQLWFE